MTVKTKSEDNAVLVTADSWYPGWQAFIDDSSEATPLLRADYLIRAIRIPKGEHTVRFVFSPAPLKTGIAIALASLIVAAAVAFSLHRRARKGS